MSGLTLLGFFQLVLWVVMELDIRRRGLEEATSLALGGMVVPVVDIAVSLWYFFDRERFCERAESLSPE